MEFSCKVMTEFLKNSYNMGSPQQKYNTKFSK